MFRPIHSALRLIAPLGIPFAWRQLTNEKKRLFAAITGITFGIMLMLFQLGLYNGIMAMVVLPHNRLGGDLMIVSRNYEYFGSAGGFSRRRLNQAESLPEVAATAPLYFGFFDWANPVTGRIKTVMAMGIDPDRNPFTDEAIVTQLPLLHQPDLVLFDTLSQSGYGPIAAMFREHGSVETEAEHKRIRVGGLYTLGPGLAANADLVLSDEAFFRVRPDKPRRMASVGLVWLKPGVRVETAAMHLREFLPQDINIVAREKFIRNEQEYWAKRTPVGFVSAAGMLVGMLVGGIVVYQILYTDVNDNLQQYATLKAIGLPPSFFVALVLEEALILVALSFLPALLLTAGMNYEAQTMAHIPCTLSIKDSLTVFGAVSLMCLLAGLLATRRLRTADPADVF